MYAVTLMLSRATGTLMAAKRSFHQRAGAPAADEEDDSDISEEAICANDADAEDLPTTVVLDDKSPKERAPRCRQKATVIPDTPSPGTTAAGAPAL